MKFLKRPEILLILIILVASFLRLWQLGNIPPSPDWDEAAYGYNAFSLLQTGKDEYGDVLPVVLRSFDDYKPALYLYLVAPFVALFGISTEAVRLPSAIAGIVTVYLTYLLIWQLFKRKDLALLTAFLLAISPWHIQFSRIGFEANVGVLLNMSMVYFFIRGLKNPKFLLLSATVAGLNIYMYQSEKVFTPLLALALVGIYVSDLRKISLKYLLSAVLLGLVIVLPMLYYLGTNEYALTRAKETSIYADKTNLTKTALRLHADTQKKDVLGLVLDNRRVFYLMKIVDGYLDHFSLNWLFITGDDNPRHHAPNMSLFYLVDLPFLLIGIYALLFLPVDKRAKLLIFLWFLLAPVPASITSGTPHAVRTINFIPTLQFLIAVGIISFVEYISSLKFHVFRYRLPYLKQVIFTVVFFLFLFNFLYYLNQYFVQLNYLTSRDWQYGYEEMVPFINSQSKDYKKIVVTNKDPLDQSYIFFLYYLNYNPKDFHKDAKRNNSGGFAETHAFGKYEFRPIEWQKEERTSDILYVGRPEDFDDKVRPLKTKAYLDGSEAIVVVKGDK